MDSVISSKNTKGTVNFSKALIHSVAKLIDVSPKSFQLFLTLSAYCDDNGSIITNKKTLSHLINEEARKVDYCLRCLQEHGYIKIEPVHVDYSKDIFGKVHDKQKYYKSKKQEWNVIDEQYSTTVNIKGTYMRIYLNKEFVSFSNGYHNTMLLYIKRNLYFDARLTNEQITVR